MCYPQPTPAWHARRSNLRHRDHSLSAAGPSASTMAPNNKANGACDPRHFARALANRSSIHSQLSPCEHRPLASVGTGAGVVGRVHKGPQYRAFPSHRLANNAKSRPARIDIGGKSRVDMKRFELIFKLKSGRARGGCG